jgi:serine/threonine protein kinase
LSPISFSRESPIAFIKYAPEELGMIEEMRNQLFAFEALEKLPLEERLGIHIPEIYRVIRRDGMVYIVMEYARGRTLASLRTEYDRDSELQEKYEQIAKAIRLFLHLTFQIKLL